ncbi:MAG: 3-phosphoshikimate 1-carboxyvinyltransferase [Verrucomicrobiota bacterium]|nr:3-phosphoshikimate 1-carboxyvinyltransferase [Verrucomicrobiota bacterium]MED5453121.1 3-phosphoshikimate 1-carboxyvinyltransferase [Verrucomicrobiota bacterium]
MSLPDIIEIVPLESPPEMEITIPGSKSITNRSLVLAALSNGEVILENALWSEDTQVMVDALKSLGYEIEVNSDPKESGNRNIIIGGRGESIPKGGTSEDPMELFVGNAGTAARFLTALLCLGDGSYRLSGVPRMHERPQASLLQALRDLGYSIDSENDKLPITIHAGGPISGTCRVSIEESSQFASALLLLSKVGGWKIEIDGELGEKSPYVAMTSRLIERFPSQGGRWRIEPDASSGSYFWAAGHILSMDNGLPVQVVHWPKSGWQIDAEFPTFLPLPKIVSRRDDLGDSIMTSIIIAPLAGHQTQFVDLGRLRLQECERVKALRTELTKCGALINESGDKLVISPSELNGAEINTYNDHRIAMCFATLGLKVPGIRVKNPDCVRKTFPTFFYKFAAPRPHGLGAILLDGQGKKLEADKLITD